MISNDGERENKRIVDFIFTPSFYSLLKEYQSEILGTPKQDIEMDTLITDIAEFIIKNNVDAKTTIFATSAVLASLIKLEKNKIPELVNKK